MWKGSASKIDGGVRSSSTRSTSPPQTRRSEIGESKTTSGVDPRLTARGDELEEALSELEKATSLESGSGLTLLPYGGGDYKRLGTERIGNGGRRISPGPIRRGVSPEAIKITDSREPC